MNYADLQVTTHFSFLRGASSPEELFASAALLGIKALGVVDRNSLAGIVRAYEAAKTTGVRLIVGCRLDLQCGTSLLVYPTDRAAYGRPPATHDRQNARRQRPVPSRLAGC
jgi:error-prone DNA polymerase